MTDNSASDLIEKLSQNETQASVRRQADRIKHQFSKSVFQLDKMFDAANSASQFGGRRQNRRFYE